MMLLLPNTGTLSDDRLDDLRVQALLAVDGSAPLPEAVTIYLRAMEAAYLRRQAEMKREFSEKSWEDRTATA